MAPKKWTTPEEESLLHSKLEKYLNAKGNQEKVPLTRFWDQLEIGFFAKFPAEAILNLPPPVEGVPSQPLTAEQLTVVGAKTALTKDRLKQWMRYHDRIRTRPTATRKAGKQKGLFKLLSKQSTRALRPVELYQGLYHAKIKEAVMARGYQGLADGDEEPAASPIVVGEVGLAEAVIASETAAKTRKRALRAARMSMWQTTARELYAEEPEEVKEEIERLTSAENVKRGAGASPRDDDVVKTPESYQFAIDQIGAVFTTVHDMTLAETGWMGFTVVGGPMPRRKGEISTKTICFGQSANGNYFSAALPDFDTRIKVPFVQWLKRVFTHDVRDARMLKTVDGQDVMNEETDCDSDDDEIPQLPDGLITMDPVPRDDMPHQESGSSERRSSAASQFKGKAASAPDHAPAPQPATLTPTPVPALITDTNPRQAPTDSTAAPEASVAPFGVLGELGDLTDFNPDFTSEDFLRDCAPFDYDAALNDVLASSEPPVTEAVSNTSSAPSVTGSNSSESVSNIPASRAFPPPSQLFLAFTPSRISTSSASSSTSTPAADASSVLPPRFEFGATPPSSAPFTFGSSTCEPPASSTSADHHVAVAHATSTQAGTNTVSRPTPRPKPKARGPSALARFNAILAANAGPVASAHPNAGAAVAAPSSTPATTVATPAARPSTPSSTGAAAAVTPTVATPAAGPSAPSSSSTTLIPSPAAVTLAPASGALSGPTTSQSTPATPTPAPVVYLQSRPMGNPPQGHALAAPIAAPAAKKRGRGRPRKNPAADVGANEDTGLGMSAAARAETTRINKEAAALRKQTAEQLRRSREMEADAAAGKKRARADDDGVFVVQRPKRAAKALLNADGTELIRPVKGRRGELRGGERLGGSFDLDAAQAHTDEELGSRLRGGKRKAAEGGVSKAPARKRERKS